MVDKKIVDEWFYKAEEDFNFAVSVMKNGIYFSQICFHFQQAAEKYLKTFIIFKELKFRKIHNLIELLEICKQVDNSFEQLQQNKYLAPFYIASRYPLPNQIEFSEEVLQKSKESAEKIGDFVRNKIGKHSIED